MTNQGGNEKLQKNTHIPHRGFQSIKIAVAFVLSFTVIQASPVFAKESEADGLGTIYHIYNAGEYLGAVSNPEPVQTLVEEKVAAKEQDFEKLRIGASKDFTIVPEQVFEPTVKEEQTIIDALDENLELEAISFALVLDEEQTVYLSNKEDYEEVLHRIKATFVSEEEMAVWEKEREMEQLPELQPGETRILELYIAPKVSGLTKRIAPEKVMTVDEAVDYLLDEKQVEVIVKKQRKINKAIKHEKITQTSADLYVGESKVNQQGKDGNRELTYAITETNGKQSGRTEIGNDVTQEAVNEIVLNGTKPLPSVGTGVFAWPAVGGYISSEQGMRWGRMHKGIDIARPSDFTIKAADHGIVRAAGADGSFGNRVIVDHQNGYETIYAHLASIDVQPGQVVQKGSKLGIMGTTGRSTGIHLHFEISKNGVLKNPLHYISQ